MDRRTWRTSKAEDREIGFGQHSHKVAQWCARVLAVECIEKNMPYESTAWSEDHLCYRSAPTTDDVLASLLLRSYPCPIGHRLVAYQVPGSNIFSGIGRRLESNVFGEFFGDTPELLAREYGPYDAASTFLVVVDTERERAAGAIRVIEPSPKSLKTLVDMGMMGLPVGSRLWRNGIADLSRVADIGSLAVRKSYRSGRHEVSSMLYGLLYRYLLARYTHFVAILAPHAHEQLSGLLGVPLQAMSEPFTYLRVPGHVAVTCELSAVESAVNRRVASFDPVHRTALLPIARRVVYGDGLPDLVEVG